MTKPISDGRRTKLLRMVGSVALLGWLGWQTDWGHVGAAFGNLHLGWWLLAAGLYYLTQVASSLRWQILARPLGFHRPITQYLSFYFIGMFFNLFLPTSVGGDVVRAWYLDGGSRRRLPAFLSVFVDRLSGLMVLLALACVATALSPITLPDWLPWTVWGTAGGIVSAMAALPLLARYKMLTGKYERLGTEIPQALLLALRPLPLILSLFVQAANVILVWMIGRSIEAPVPASYYWIMVPMVSLLTMLPISLNGMGVREGATVFLLKPLGISTGTALTLSFLWFAVFTAASLAGVGFYLFGRFPRYEVRPDDEPVRSDPDQGRARQSQAAA